MFDKHVYKKPTWNINSGKADHSETVDVWKIIFVLIDKAPSMMIKTIT